MCRCQAALGAPLHMFGVALEHPQSSLLILFQQLMVQTSPCEAKRAPDLLVSTKSYCIGHNLFSRSQCLCEPPLPPQYKFVCGCRIKRVFILLFSCRTCHCQHAKKAFQVLVKQERYFTYKDDLHYFTHFKMLLQIVIYMYNEKLPKFLEEHTESL